MPSNSSDIRSQAATHIRAALDLGVRKDLRSALQHALDIAEGSAPKELSDLHYRRLPPGGRLTDPQRPGLIMRSGRTGLKRWTYRYEVAGRQREVTLGHYPDMTVAAARERWVELRSQRASGEAPDNRDQTTLEELVDHYIGWARQNLRSWKANERMLRKHLLPGRERVTLGELTSDHLNVAITTLQSSAPQEARKLKSAISGVLTRGRKDSLLPKSFTITPSLLAEVETAKPRTWHPGTRDLRAFLQATREMGDTGEALRLVALTGVRLNEGAGMRWDELEGNRWTLPASRMKAGRPHVVLLSDAALALVEARRGNGSDFVFRARRSIAPRWADKRDALGLDRQFTVHTLRKALATWVAENGGTRDIRDRLTAHTLASGIDAFYNQAELNAPAAEWWQRWADHLAAIEGANVVLLAEDRA